MENKKLFFESYLERLIAGCIRTAPCGWGQIIFLAARQHIRRHFGCGLCEK